MTVSKTLLFQAKQLPLKKQLSQHFLVDEAIIEAIVQACEAGQTGPVHLLEIGPGAGFLTQKLLERGHRLDAYEVDEDMIEALAPLKASYSSFTLHHESILKASIAPLLNENSVIVGNLPYHLTGPILELLCGSMGDTEYALRKQQHHSVIMVQKEVGQRLSATPGNKTYGQLTLQCQCWFDIEPVVDVPKACFWTPPKVDSMVLSLKPRLNPAVEVPNYAFLSQLIKDAFLHRRKTILNSLKATHRYDLELIADSLNRQNIDLTSRAEVISLAQYGQLCDDLYSPA